MDCWYTKRYTFYATIKPIKEQSKNTTNTDTAYIMTTTEDNYIYIYIVVTTKEFSENKVLNIVNVEL